MRKKKVNSAAEAEGKQIKPSNEQTRIERKEYWVSFPSLMKKKINLENLVGKFNSCFLCQALAANISMQSQTSNERFLLLMTGKETDPCQYYSVPSFLPFCLPA